MVGEVFCSCCSQRLSLFVLLRLLFFLFQFSPCGLYLRSQGNCDRKCGFVTRRKRTHSVIVSRTLHIRFSFSSPLHSRSFNPPRFLFRARPKRSTNRLILSLVLFPRRTKSLFTTRQEEQALMSCLRRTKGLRQL